MGSFGIDYSDGRGTRQLRELFDKAKADGFNFVRIWAFTVQADYALQVRGLLTLCDLKSLMRAALLLPQISPGYYAEEIFVGLDRILHEAAQRNLKVVLVLADWWCGTCKTSRIDWRRSTEWLSLPRTHRLNPGGVPQYLSWNPSARTPEDFFTDSGCKAMFKRHMLTMVQRVNTGMCQHPAELRQR
jgi:hypothetical protein